LSICPGPLNPLGGPAYKSMLWVTMKPSLPSLSATNKMRHMRNWEILVKYHHLATTSKQNSNDPLNLDAMPT